MAGADWDPYRVVVLLQNPFLTQLQLPDWWQEILIKNLLIGVRIHVSLVIWSRPGPEAEKPPQTFTFPPPCFTVGRRLFSWYAVLAFLQTWRFWLWPNNSILDSSVQRMDFQKASGLSKCSLAKLKRAALFFLESRGFFLATLPWMSCLFNFRLIVDACTFTPDAAREVYISRGDVWVGLYLIYYFSGASWW